MASNLLGIIPYMAIASIVIVGFFIFAIYYRSKGKQIDILNIGTKSPSNIKPKLIYKGKNGKSYNAEVISLEQMGGGLAKIDLYDEHIGAFQLHSVGMKKDINDKDNNLIIPFGWANVVANGITIFCNIDATNTAYPWDTESSTTTANDASDKEQFKREAEEDFKNNISRARAMLKEPSDELRDEKNKQQKAWMPKVD